MTSDTGKTCSVYDSCRFRKYVEIIEDAWCCQSFVAGSDGHLYEGRGWLWQGAHTLGHNSIGYGVSFIGDYTSSLPSQHSMGLVRDNLATCAVGGGRLEANFTLQGHRQVVSTSCPGDALYSEIQGWEHFGVCTYPRQLLHLCYLCMKPWVSW